MDMTSLINGVSKPCVMDLDGRNKEDVSGGTSGFTYGLSASPDGKFISYREGVRQLFVMRLSDRSEHRLTDLAPGHAAMWAHWQPVATSA